MSMASYLSGNRVYKGASNAPTRGTVDPMGYVERGLNQISQKRSGLAAAALRRLTPGQSTPPDPFGGRTGGVDTRTPTGGGVGGNVSTISGGGAGVGPTAQPLKVTNIGKLQPQLGASEGATSLPYDPQAADDQLGLQSLKNRFESDATAEQQRIEREYLTQRRGVEKQMPDASRGLLENYAGRGLAYSSGYSYDQGNLQGQYADLLAQLEQGKTGGIADLLRQRGMFNDDYSMRLQQIQQAAARRLAEQAGDLGLGGAPTDGQSILDDLFNGGGGATGTPESFAPPTPPAPAPAPEPTRLGGPQAPAPQISPDAITQAATPRLNDPSRPAGIDNPILRPGDAPTPNSPLNALDINPEYAKLPPAPTPGRYNEGTGYMPPTAPAPAPTRTHIRDMGSFDPRSRTILSQGGTIRGGNGLMYKYDPNTGMVVPV